MARGVDDSHDRLEAGARVGGVQDAAKTLGRDLGVSRDGAVFPAATFHGFPETRSPFITTCSHDSHVTIVT